MANSLHVVTSLFIPSGAEKLPPHIEAAFTKHFASPLIQSVLILTEANSDLVAHLCGSLPNSEKCEVVACDKRPAFSRLFEAGSSLLTSRGGVAAVMNADISFANDAAIELCISSLLEVSRSNPSCIYGLTRYDYDTSEWRLCLYEESGAPNFLSADCWVFASPISLPEGDFYALGHMNCDFMVNYDLTAAGHNLYNPCLDIEIHHHEVELKEHEYYASENQQEEALHRLWHFAPSRGVIPRYNFYGLPWIHSDWLLSGYRPLPYSTRAKKLFLAVPDGSLSDLIPVIFGADIFSCAYGYDIVLVFESEPAKVFEELLPIARKNRNFYMIRPKGGTSNFVDSLLQHGYNDGNTIAYASNAGFLTKQLVESTEIILIDLRSAGSGSTPCKLPPLTGYDANAFNHRHPGQNYGMAFQNEDATGSDRKCTLVTSVFKAEEFIPSFLNNCLELEGYRDHIEHIFLFSASAPMERRCLIDHTAANPNSMLIWNRKDPGLYECWNLGIRLAKTKYVSNANVDDLRAPSHVRELVEVLEEHHDKAVAATALLPFYEYTGEIDGIESSNPWYADRAGSFCFSDLFELHQAEDSGEWNMNPHNMPHCMPVWRRSIHDSYGMFDEQRYGTFADWEFWLRITKSGESGYIHPAPLSYYFVNLASHNRRGNELNTFHNRIAREYIPYALNGHQLMNHPKSEPSKPQPKLNLLGRNVAYGVHRNSFNSIIDCLDPLHLGSDGVDFLPFLERYFVWGDEPGEAGSSDPKPLTKPWIGILHVPFDSPTWFHAHIHPESFFQTELWRQSLNQCRGIICLSEDLQFDLKQYYPDLPSVALKHPTGQCERTFEFERYRNRPRLVQVGDWLRRLQAIYQVVAPSHEKMILLKQYTRDYIGFEINALGDFRNDSVKELDFVSNEEYDDILSSSVVLCLLYGSAANNAVIECIARATPIIINPLPSVVEYLGADYPLYATNAVEAGILLLDTEVIKLAHEALIRRRSEIDLSYDGFKNSFASSDFYTKL